VTLLSGLLLATAVGVVSGILLELYRRWALHRAWLDRPNERSSHRSPVPGSGGLAFVPPWVLALALTPTSGHAPAMVALALAAGLLCALGAVDDRVGLSVRLRLAVQGVTVGAFLWVLLREHGSLPAPAWMLFPAGVWAINLFNFMDGIDGFAATQALLALVAGAVLAFVRFGAADFVVCCVLPAAALAAFLPFNRPRAKLFMGDAGSLPLGFTLFALALTGESSGVLPATCWLVMLTPFVLDATLTLLFRALRGANIAAAHREHFYQRLARRWHSHGRVNGLLLASLLFWCLPFAAAIAARPGLELPLSVLALLPPAWVMAKLRRLQ